MEKLRKPKLKTSLAQRKASAKWDAKNPERKKRRSYRSACKLFIVEYANNDELEEIINLVNMKFEENNQNEQQ